MLLLLMDLVTVNVTVVNGPGDCKCPLTEPLDRRHGIYSRHRRHAYIAYVKKNPQINHMHYILIINMKQQYVSVTVTI